MQQSPRTFALRGAVALAYAGWIWHLSSLPGSGDVPLPFAHFDKLLHGLLFAGMGGLVLWTLTAWRPSTWRALAVRAGGITTLYGVVDELHQSFVVGRHADPMDVLADAAGAALAIAIWRAFGRGCCS